MLQQNTMKAVGRVQMEKVIAALITRSFLLKFLLFGGVAIYMLPILENMPCSFSQPTVCVTCAGAGTAKPSNQKNEKA